MLYDVGHVPLKESKNSSRTGMLPRDGFFSQRPVIDRKVSLEISSNLFVEP
jgi:hypothetical protein